MHNLIEALQIFAKYKDLEHPTHCEHDVLQIAGITKEEISAEDAARLDALGFLWSVHDGGSWISYRFGSA
jgi:hypothetical protein